MKTCINYLRTALAGVALLTVAAGSAEAAADSAPRKKRIPVADFADDARMDVLRWLVKLEPAFATFQARFTYARPVFLRADAYSPRISVIVNLRVGKYTITFITSAEFTDDLSRASKSRIEAFTALVPIKGTLYTLQLPPNEMKEFAADPEGYIEKTVAALKKK